MTQRDEIYGLVAEFEGPEPLLEAVRRLRAEGFCALDAFTPFPIAGLSQAIGHRRTRLPAIVLIGGMTGVAGGFLMQTYAHVFDYQYLVAGRAYFSWQAFIPITFELGILFAALSAVFGMLALNRLPRPYHPVFNTPGFKRASVDRFFLAVESGDPRYHPRETAELLGRLGALRVHEVPCWLPEGARLPGERRARQVQNLAALRNPSPVVNEEGVSDDDQT